VENRIRWRRARTVRGRGGAKKGGRAWELTREEEGFLGRRGRGAGAEKGRLKLCLTDQLESTVRTPQKMARERRRERSRREGAEPEWGGCRTESIPCRGGYRCKVESHGAWRRDKGKPSCRRAGQARKGDEEVRLADETSYGGVI